MFTQAFYTFPIGLAPISFLLNNEEDSIDKSFIKKEPPVSKRDTYEKVVISKISGIAFISLFIYFDEFSFQIK